MRNLQNLNKLWGGQSCPGRPLGTTFSRLFQVLGLGRRRLKTVPRGRLYKLVAAAALMSCALLPAQTPPAPEKQVLFDSRIAGYAGFRIPAMVMTGKGTLLAFCAARKGMGDWDDIRIMMRRSTDGGRTWAPARTIAEHGAMTADNPTPIVDRVTGAVHFLFQNNYSQLLYMRSDDDGQTFSTPVDITEVVHEYRRGWVSGVSTQHWGWNVVAPGPGHSIQLSSGRLLAGIWMSPQYVHRPSAVATIYSDDHGKTWQRGEIILNDLKNPSENMAVELADGSVMLNIRSESEQHLRAVAISQDGAGGWSKPVFQPDLYEGICMASLIRLSRQPERKNRLVFSSPDSRGQPDTRTPWPGHSRDNLTLRLSYDEGKTWPVSKLLEGGSTGYSDLAAGPDGIIYVLYERLDSDRKYIVTVARVTLDWLTDGKDSWETH
jgi:sialidase-1